MTILNVYDINYSFISALPSVHNKSGKRRKVEYVDLVCAFDIETSTAIIDGKYQSYMYIWQWQFDEYMTVIGRTWHDFVYMIEQINKALDKRRLIVFVHNLYYEFQFIRSLFDIQPDNVFVVKSRRVLRYLQGQVEFRCSYLLSNMSLKDYTKKWNVAHQKLSGDDFDYSELRYPDTELTQDQLDYCINDVIGLVESIKAEIAFHDDNLYTLPLTSTGYVRRDIKRAVYMTARHQIATIRPDLDRYKLLRLAFRGGNTHANRYLVKGEVFNIEPHKQVKNIDRSSSYPDVIVNCQFPIDKFKHVERPVSYDELQSHYIKKRHYAILAKIQITDLHLIDKYYPCPYIGLSNCTFEKDVQLDNGRLLSAAMIEICVTDIDLQIIASMYELNNNNVKILDCYFATYGYLPDELRALTIEYYKQKTELKGIPDKKLLYDKFKNLINAIYGCSAQDPGKAVLLYDQNAIDTDELYINDDSKTLEELLSNQKTALPYQWGVWVTCLARHKLQLAIDYVHTCKTSEFLYCDTDSVKYIGDIDVDALNADLIEQSKSNGAFASDIHGNVHYMGSWEIEKTYDKFATMGAKSYVYEIDGKLGITIAGVPKIKGAMELERLGGFDAYKIGTIFHDGLTETKYNDERQWKEIELNGHKIELTSNMSIIDSFHKIGYSKDYGILLEQITDKDIEHVLDFI